MPISFTVLLRQGLFLALLAIPVAVLTGFLHPRTPVWGEPPLGPGEIRLTTALEWENALWLDARSRTEYDAGHVPGALLLNEDEWEGLFFDMIAEWNPARKIVVYCGGSQCEASTKVADRLRMDLGDAEVYVLKGGWSEWSREGEKR